jgi:hypothetical protein
MASGRRRQSAPARRRPSIALGAISRRGARRCRHRDPRRIRGHGQHDDDFPVPGCRFQSRVLVRETDNVTAELIEEFTDWLDERDAPDTAAFASHAEMFLNWRESAPLETLDHDDLREFLLGWCPRKLSMPAEESWEVCEAVAEFVCFLGATGRMDGGPERARAMMRTVIGLTDTMTVRMADPANFGMAKSLFAGIADADRMSQDELAAAIQQRVEEHNALPMDLRQAATDRFFEPPAAIELPFLYIPPPEADVAAAVARAVLPEKVRKLRDYLGGTGAALTAKGNLKLADGRALVELLDTGDALDEKIGEKIFKTRSTAELSQLTYLVELAMESGALRHLNKRLVPVKAWAKKSPVEQATALFQTAVELGVLSEMGAGHSFYGDLHNLLDEGVVHWLAALLSPDAQADFDDIVELNRSVVNSQFTGRAAQHYLSGGSLARDIGRILEILDMTGAVQWSGRRESVPDWGRRYSTGGTVALTAFGRHALPDLLPEAGLSLRAAAELTEVDLNDLIAAMDEAPPEQHSAMLAAWQPSLSESERAGAVAAMITDTDEAHTRLVGLRLLGMFDPDVAEPHMRQLLDTTAAGHAAIWLLDHGLADPDTVGGFITPAALLDILSELVEVPEVLCEQFLSAPDPDAILEFLWRHPAPETAAVLDALGRHLPDRALAKQARKAALRHRSWLANGGTSSR